MALRERERSTRTSAVERPSRGATGGPPRPPTAWTLVVEPDGRPGPINMAVDLALLRMAARPTHRGGYLRLYRWAPPSLSLGRHEPARRRYDPLAIRRLGLNTVRRPTGGRAVWHEHEVTYAVAGPADMFGSLADAYIRIHALLRDALWRLGAAAELAPRPTHRLGPVEGGACFASPAGGEIVVAGRKVVGSAQVREGGAFLQHGSILLEGGQEMVARITRNPAGAPQATSLSAVLGRPVSFPEVAGAIAVAARQHWSGHWREGSVEPDPTAVTRFADPAWTWRR